jgi:hypothetical protein
MTVSRCARPGPALRRPRVDIDKPRRPARPGASPPHLDFAEEKNEARRYLRTRHWAATTTSPLHLRRLPHRPALLRRPRQPIYVNILTKPPAASPAPTPTPPSPSPKCSHPRTNWLPDDHATPTPPNSASSPSPRPGRGPGEDLRRRPRRTTRDAAARDRGEHGRGCSSRASWPGGSTGRRLLAERGVGPEQVSRVAVRAAAVDAAAGEWRPSCGPAARSSPLDVEHAARPRLAALVRSGGPGTAHSPRLPTG